MKAPSPAFSLYPKDVMTDENVSAMTDQEFGVYVRLLCHAWLEGSIPADLERIARMLKRPLRTIKRLWPAIAPCWEEAHGRLTQRKLEAVRAKQVAFSEAQSKKGKLGGKPSVINDRLKLGLSRGKAAAEPEQSLPFPSSIPTPASTESINPPARVDAARELAKAAADLADFPAAKRPVNARSPHIADGERPKWELEALRLTREIATAEGVDGAEVLAAASHYEGARTSKTNPANMTEDRLVNTVLALRKRASPAPSTVADPAELWIEANGGREKLARECAAACGWSDLAAPRASWREKRGAPDGVAALLHWPIRQALEAHKQDQVNV